MYACVYDILKNYYSIRQGALLNRGASIEAVKEYNLNCFGFFLQNFSTFSSIYSLLGRNNKPGSIIP